MATRLSQPIEVPHHSSSPSCQGTARAATIDMATPESQPPSTGFIVAHIQELEAATATSKPRRPRQHTTSMALALWQPFAESPNDHLAAIWPPSHRPRSAPAAPAPLVHIPHHPRSAPAAPTPLVHIPHCRLKVASVHDPAHPAKVEQVALPRRTVQAFLSGIPLPPGSLPAAAHFDDASEWVYSRCLLADFSEFGEDEASHLSAQGRMCCWASVVLMRDAAESAWDLGFVVHKVFAHRSPDGSGCGCF
ncbi:hypothetical protein B0H67DRAFT_563426 [Lasiosphaeris hirsuta]|uniref:Uncharacterized protein n=1 Tax=Lasiosphaeris hirsuta TaxID=260670 RepID=A0AA40BB48_9PEZI|nr:hypothetical protein B0H67DRAFT_563426 [Lasiosphaeris hirsuta]